MSEVEGLLLLSCFDHLTIVDILMEASKSLGGVNLTDEVLHVRNSQT